MSRRGPSAYDPSWADVLSRMMDNRLARVWVALPGRIEAFNNTTGLADVVLLLRDLVDNSAGGQSEVEFKKLTNVPVLVLGGVLFRIKIPVEVGTLCEVHFNDMSLDEWKSGDGSMVTPLNDERHALNGAVAVIGLRPAGKAWTGPNDRITIGKDGSNFQVAVGQALIELGYPQATDFVALASQVDANFQAQQIFNNTHVHPTAVGPSDVSLPGPVPVPTGSISVAVKP